MNQRERLINTLRFKAVDRVPLVEFDVRRSTMDAWIEQGYPSGTPVEQFFGLDNGLDNSHLRVPFKLYMNPPFENIILEQNENYKVWQDPQGAIRRDFIRDREPGFVTRSYLKFPVDGREDFLEMKKRYRSDDPFRIIERWKIRAAALNASTVPVNLWIPFLFWTIRDWMGFEGICLGFHDQPMLIREMCEFLIDYYIELLTPVIDDVAIDLVVLNEDMAYKHAPMISPDMFRKFLFPEYVRFIGFLKSHGVKIVCVDSDGFPGGLIPPWIDAGVDGMLPCEIAAGNDLIKLRKEYPKFVMAGGIDKRELSTSKEAVYNEVMSKVPFLLEKGGYIPQVDHAVPPDVPLRNFIYYRELIERLATGG
jgi:uroporphyrinogen decarboxylase